MSDVRNTITTILLISVSIALIITNFSINNIRKEKSNNIGKSDTIVIVQTNWLKVRGTCFNPTKGQTDKDPSKTASGAKLNLNSPLEHRYAGLSKDLLKVHNPNAPFDYGDTIIIYGTGVYDGAWTVRDCAASFVRRKGKVIVVRNTVDFLVGIKDSMNMWKDIYITKLNK